MTIILTILLSLVPTGAWAYPSACSWYDNLDFLRLTANPMTSVVVALPLAIVTAPLGVSCSIINELESRERYKRDTEREWDRRAQRQELFGRCITHTERDHEDRVHCRFAPLKKES